MNKTQIIDAVAKETGIKKKDAEAAVNSAFSIIEATLLAGEKVQLVGFGTFEVKNRAERKGRNPKTGESVTVPACKYLAFSSAKAIKEKLN